MEYNICYTGSKGNSNIINVGNLRFLVDCGVPYKWLEEKNMLDERIDMLLISHRHSDHINISTYNHLRRKFPNMKVITNYEVSQFIKDKKSHYQPHYIIDSGMSLSIGSITINFIENDHGVQTQGYIFEKDGETLLYATDLSTTVYYQQFLDTKGVQLDICLLENNYSIEKLMEKLDTHTGYNLAESQSRHLEHKDFFNFVSKYCKVPENVVELHQSSSLY